MKFAVFILGAWLLTGDVAAGAVIGGLHIEERQMTLTEVTLLFTGSKAAWRNGETVQIVCYQEHSAEQMRFLYEVLGLTEYMYQERVDRNLYLGRIGPPIRVRDAAEMILRLKQSPNAIGYVDDVAILQFERQLIIIRIVR